LGKRDKKGKPLLKDVKERAKHGRKHVSTEVQKEKAHDDQRKRISKFLISHNR